MGKLLALVGGGILGVAIFIALIIFGPILVIWAMNVMFPVLAIPVTLKTWFATIVLFAAIKPTVNNNIQR